MRKVFNLFILTICIWGCQVNSKEPLSTKSDPPKMMFQISLEREINEPTVLDSLTLEELRILRNGIFARRGYSFDSEELNKYFKKFDWYTPNPHQEEVLKLLTEVDKKNISILKNVENLIAQEISNLKTIDHDLQDGKKLFILDSTLYSPIFINDLRELAPVYESLTLIGNMLTIDETVTGKLPTYLENEFSAVYKSRTPGADYILKIKRLNLTTIDYSISTVRDLIKSGQATISGGFFLGAESNEDKDGNAYFVDEFIDSSDDCWTSIRIDMVTVKRATLGIFYEEDTSKNLTDLPIFIRE